MPVATPESQFKFLISCIRWSNSGKVDFVEVAKECRIVSKGAAAKRYERMMKIHGIAPNATPQKASLSGRGVKAEPKDTNFPPTKKRKVDNLDEDHGTVEDDTEQFENIKPEISSHNDEFRVKVELGQMGNDNCQAQLPYLHFDSEDTQNYNTGRNMYEQNTLTYNGYNSLGGMENPAPFVSFGEYGQSSTVGGVKVPTEISRSESESIVILE